MWEQNIPAIIPKCQKYEVEECQDDDNDGSAQVTLMSAAAVSAPQMPVEVQVARAAPTRPTLRTGTNILPEEQLGPMDSLNPFSVSDTNMSESEVAKVIVAENRKYI